MIAPIKHNAGGAGIDERADFLPEAGIDEIECAVEVDTEVGIARAPDSGDSSGMEDCMNTRTRLNNNTRVLDISLKSLCSGCLDSRVKFAGEDADVMSELAELLNEVESEKSATTCDEHLHLFWGRVHFLTKKNQIFLAGNTKVAKRLAFSHSVLD
jgi:hypothetical protein